MSKAAAKSAKVGKQGKQDQLVRGRCMSNPTTNSSVNLQILLISSSCILENIGARLGDLSKICQLSSV